MVVASQQKKTLRIQTAKSGLAFKDVRTGASGTMDVVNECADLVRDINYFDENFPTFVVDKILKPNRLNSYSSLVDKLQAIYEYVAANITYVSDVKGIESIKDARTTVSTGFGDCDDLSILTATCIAAIGLTPSFVIAKIYNASATPDVKNPLAYKSVAPVDYNHIYTIVVNGDKTYTLDAALIKPAFDVESDYVTEKKIISIFGNRGVSDFAGMDTVYKSVAWNVGNVARTLLPFSALAPIPFAGKVGGTIASLTGLDKEVITLSSLTTEIHQKLDLLIVQVRDGQIDKDFALKQANTLLSMLINNIQNAGVRDTDKSKNVYIRSVRNKINILAKTMPLTR